LIETLSEESAIVIVFWFILRRKVHRKSTANYLAIEVWDVLLTLRIVVAADDSVPLALWTRIFLKEQGCESETTIYQDKTSAMLLEKNGKKSSSKRTMCINIGHFFIKDSIDKGYLIGEHCPIDDMIEHCPSKPLQGRKFKKHKALIMSHNSILAPLGLANQAWWIMHCTFCFY